MIRDATGEDAPAVAALVFASDPAELVSWAGSAGAALGLLERAAKREGTQLAPSVTRVADERGVVGAVTAYPAGELTARFVATLRCGWRNPVAWPSLWRAWRAEGGWLPDDGWVLDALAVAPRERGRGVGRRLLDDVVARATAAGASCVALLLDPHNAAARRLYDSAGFAVACAEGRRLTMVRHTKDATSLGCG